MITAIRREYNKKYYQLNKEHLDKINQEWAKNNKEKSSQYFKKWRKEHPEYYKNYFLDPENEKKHRELDKKYQRRIRALGLIDKAKESREWRAKNPDAAKAHKIVYHAIKKGILIREECELKDKLCSDAKIQAHHENYNEPLVVNWLCPSHHKLIDLGIIKLKDNNYENIFRENRVGA